MDDQFVDEIVELARRIRIHLVEMSHRARAPHLGSSLSCVDILAVLYSRVLDLEKIRQADPLRHRFILSKGHAAAALYAVLAEKDLIPQALLQEYAQDGAVLPEQPSPGSAPGIEAATGSLGHGLSLGLGMALAGRIQERDCSVTVLLSDGECNEGSVWEAALFAAAQRLSRVTAIIDYNAWQATGRSNDIMALAPLAAKWQAFGWRTQEIDGHDLPQLVESLTAPPCARHRPTAIIAHTVKGKGVSFMEDDNNWHYRIPNETEVEEARRELSQCAPGINPREGAQRI